MHKLGKFREKLHCTTSKVDYTPFYKDRFYKNMEGEISAIVLN